MVNGGSPNYPKLVGKQGSGCSYNKHLDKSATRLASKGARRYEEAEVAKLPPSKKKRQYRLLWRYKPELVRPGVFRTALGLAGEWVPYFTKYASIKARDAALARLNKNSRFWEYKIAEEPQPPSGETGG